MTFTIQLGPYSQEYHLHKTSAPRDYDGFGTLELCGGSKERLVLISREASEWQLARYASTLGGGAEEYDLDPKYVADILHGRLLRDSAPGTLEAIKAVQTPTNT